MPPKKTSVEYMQEWRNYKAQYGSVPREKPGTPGCALAQRIRQARWRGVFDDIEMAELDAGKLSKGHGASSRIVKLAKKSKPKV